MPNCDYLDSLIDEFNSNTVETIMKMEKFMKNMSEDDRHTATGKRAIELHAKLSVFLTEFNKI